MMKPNIYLQPVFLKLIAAVMFLCHFGPVAAETVALPGGFRLGSSLDDAKQHAISQGWQLAPVSAELPGSWLVKGQKIGIYVCNDTVASVSQSSPGNLDDFARLVSDLQMERGKPQLQIGTFMAGSTRISTVDARFAESGGLNITVQFGSYAGVLTISTNYFSDTCEERPEVR
jgi:hypothetical protein